MPKVFTRISLLCATILFIPINAFTQSPYFHLKPLNKLKMSGITRQTLDYSCGAAALSLLLKNYFGDDREEEIILKDIAYRLSKKETFDRVTEGFSMLDLKKAAQRFGYASDGVLLSQKAVTKLKGPVVILLRKKDLNHFVILKGITQSRAFIADPVRGHIRMPLHDLFAQWKGETLILGRKGFGLPQKHGLSILSGNAVAPEREVVRVLQHLPSP